MEALRSWRFQASPSFAAKNATLVGRTTGLANSTVNREPPVGSCPSRPLSSRAADHMPWAMRAGKPKAFAPSAETWIGFLSPEASA